MDNIGKGVVCFSSTPGREKLTSTFVGLWSSKLFDPPIRQSLSPLPPLRGAIGKRIRMWVPTVNTAGTKIVSKKQHRRDSKQLPRLLAEINVCGKQKIQDCA